MKFKGQQPAEVYRHHFFEGRRYRAFADPARKQAFGTAKASRWSMGWFTDGKEKKGEQNAFCSFCRKNYREVGPLVAGPSSVFICTSCVHLCHAIIQQEQARRQGKVRAFLVPGSTYRFTTTAGTWVGIVRARLEHPHEHWVQVEAVSVNDNACSEPTWINLLQAYAVSEVAGADTSEVSQAPSTPASTDFRIIDKRGTLG
jgi:hypothetical protein